MSPRVSRQRVKGGGTAVKRLWTLNRVGQFQILVGSGQVQNSFELSFPILVVVRIESDHVCQVSDIKEMLSKCWLVNK